MFYEKNTPQLDSRWSKKTLEICTYTETNGQTFQNELLDKTSGKKIFGMRCRVFESGYSFVFVNQSTS